MHEIPRLRYIPYRPDELARRCLADLALAPEQLGHFEHTREKVTTHLQQEFLALRKGFIATYFYSQAPTTTPVSREATPSEAEQSASDALRELLSRADYERLPKSSVGPIVDKNSLSKVRVSVELDDFSESAVFTRHPTRRSKVISSFFGLRKKSVEFISFDRVVLFARLAAPRISAVAAGEQSAQNWVLKLFSDVPAADLEMVFPNIQIRMRTLDKVMIGIPALISGVMVVSTKLGASLLLLASLVGFWLGMHSEPVALNRTTLLILLAGAGALAMYLWQQWGKFKRRRLRYSEALTQHLYTHLLDDGAGVFFRLLFEAEEAELKECLLTYHLLLARSAVKTEDALDKAITGWLDKQGDTLTAFHCKRALHVLESLDLVTCENDAWSANPPQYIAGDGSDKLTF